MTFTVVGREALRRARPGSARCAPRTPRTTRAPASITGQASTTLRSGTKGSTATRASSLPVARREAHHAALVRRPHLGPDVDAQALEQRRQRAQLLRVVVVAGDHDAGDPLGQQPGQEVVDELLGLGRRRRRVEDVAGHEHRVDLRVDRDPRHLRRAPPRARRGASGRAASCRCASRPCAGSASAPAPARSAHRGSPRTGRRRPPRSPRSCAWPRPGTGSAPAAASGSPAAARSCVPGFRIPARAAARRR